jgi:hypothetical protein
MVYLFALSEKKIALEVHWTLFSTTFDSSIKYWKGAGNVFRAINFVFDTSAQVSLKGNLKAKFENCKRTFQCYTI